jgi:uncharacterized repeat protein (TIGR02543 family)
MSTALSACNNGSNNDGNNDDTRTFQVTFDYNYPDAPSPIVVNVNDGETVAEPAAPTRQDYDFTGWFTDSACNTAFVFTTAITANTTLYAGWNSQIPIRTGITGLSFTSSVTALQGIWTVVKVYANGNVSDAVANAITLSITLNLDPYELVDGDAYIHNQVYNLSGIMTFGINAINTILSADDVENYRGDASWDSFVMGKVVNDGGVYQQPGPAIMNFRDIDDYGLFLDLVAGVSAQINTKNRNLIIGMNNDGQLLLGYSSVHLELPSVNGDWEYCLIFEKAIA